MMLLLVGTAVVLALALVLALVLYGSLRLTGRTPRRFWRRFLRIQIPLLLLAALLLVPGALGFVASRRLGTRGDERWYRGPDVDENNVWNPQWREQEGSPRGEGSAATVVEIPSSDDVTLRGFLVPGRAPASARPLSAVLVHGFVRGGLEIDPVGAVFHKLGLDVLLLETRNHGGSSRAPFTGGRDESRDVVAGARWMRARPGHEGDGIILFGVSLGAGCVALASPHVEGLVGLVLDAPFRDLETVAHRSLRHRVAMPQPFRSLVLTSWELWSHFDLEEVRPETALRKLSPKVPVLLIGGGTDRRMPPDEVRAVFDLLPTAPDRKELWIRPESGHGQVWRDDPAGYEEHLRALVRRARAP